MSLTHKIDFAVVFTVTNANPNGDPLNANRPRMTFGGTGEVSDVCLKRKIRDRLIENKQSVFVMADEQFPTLQKRAEAGIAECKNKPFAQFACEKWFDVRAFGQVFAYKAKGAGAKKGKAKQEQAEDDAGADSVSIGIRGPVTIQSAFSVEPVDINSMQITKSVSNEENNGKKSSDTMGMKHRVEKGTYVFFGSMSPQLAEKTGFSDADAEVIKKILPQLFENDASSARPDGSMQVTHVIWWKHASKNGDCSSAKVHASLHVDSKGDVTIDKTACAVKECELIPGF